MMEPGTDIDWKETGIVVGAILAVLALAGKAWHWRPVQWAWLQIRTCGRWLGRGVIAPLFKHELDAVADREKRLKKLEAIAVLLERDIVVVGDKVAAALIEVGERVDASVCMCRDQIADLADATRDALADVAEAQRGTNRILQAVVTQDPKKISEALIQTALSDDPPAEYKGEDRRSRRARGDRPGEEPKVEGERRRQPRTRQGE